jgi:hypothetical protein
MAFSPHGWPRGFLTIPDQYLVLRFMVNPVEITKTKSASYDIINVPGMDTPIITYTGGSEKVLSLKLFFDTSDPNTQSGIIGFPRPFGVLQIEAVIEMMMIDYSQMSSTDISSYQRKMEETVGAAGGALMSSFRPLPGVSGKSLRAFRPNPDIYFIFGLQWFKVKIRSAPMTERRWRKFTLIPDQLNVDLEMLVIEDGTFHQLDIQKRQAMAMFESASAASESLTLDLINFGGTFR